MRELHRRLRRVLCRRIRRALVEHHRDVDSEVPELKVHGALGAQRVRRAVDVASEEHALLGESPASGQRHDLIAAGVRENRPVPSNEAVQPPEAPDDVAAGTEHEVVGIREHDLGARRLDVAPPRGFHGSRRSDRHERGRLDAPVVESQPSAPRASRAPGGRQNLEAQHPV